ncbi:putative asparagine--tRNA ligase [Clavispora lusitaniae]|uniref:asparagine--tRNA ligase n=1 Tax=Clavispora lusitaniae TaxID=36911 RepID=A0AA91PYN4_CLALS|nr:putative asparagine--tRNA ligase [Clavispora lusitaniae]
MHILSGKAVFQVPKALAWSWPSRCLSGISRTIQEVFDNPPETNSTITTHGHIKSIRTFKNIGFIDITDGTIFQTLNVVLSNPEDVFASGKYKVGQSVSISGSWVQSKGNQKYELQYDHHNPHHSIKLIGDVSDDYPIQKKVQSLSYLRSVPHLRHRTATLASILRFRSRVEQHAMNFFAKNGFTKVAPPLITSSDCEGAGEMFSIEPFTKADSKEKFFGQDAFLTVSTQLHLEVLAPSLNRVWTLTPCFRAEQSNTNRHLSEFWMLEAEVCYVENISQLTDLVEDSIRSIAKDLKTDPPLQAGGLNDLTKARYSESEQLLVQQRCDSLLGENRWPSITYTEAIDIINSVKNKGRSKNRMTWGDSISTEQEKWLAGTHFQSPVFVTDYPREQKPFYMPLSKYGLDKERPTVACFDLIVPEFGELVGGSLREHRHDELHQEIIRRGMNAESMQWYLSLRQNGTVPHGGFGMGFERLIAYLAAIENIKDISAFPRAPQICPC